MRPTRTSYFVTHGVLVIVESTLVRPHSAFSTLSLIYIYECISPRHLTVSGRCLGFDLFATIGWVKSHVEHGLEKIVRDTLL